MQVPSIALWALVHTIQCGVFPIPKELTDVAKVDALPNSLNATANANNVDARRNTGVEARRARKKSERSTSSSSGEKIAGETDGSEDSLGIESSDDESSDDSKDNRKQGWRHWHRKCKPCPEEMLKKWRDPTIKWICGGYQRARRSFKSECMMELRNCQDGTMFVKIHEHRCDDKAPGYNGGRHFFYDYAVNLPDDTSGKSSVEESSDSDAENNDS